MPKNSNIFDTRLVPLSFLERTAATHPEYPAEIFQDVGLNGEEDGRNIVADVEAGVNVTSAARRDAKS